MSESLTIAEAQLRLPEVVEHLGERGRVLLCQNGQPVAAVVSTEELSLLDRLRAAIAPGSLVEIIGQWEEFDEIEPFIREARESARREAGVYEADRVSS